MSMQRILPCDRDTLTACLEEILPDLYGANCGIAGMEESRSEHSTFYRSRIVRVSLSSGEQLELFLKDFGSFEKPKDEMESRRERELRVYRDLLSGAELGTPRYYGCSWDESKGRFWLLLELVSGSHLRHCPFEHWVRAAAWLGRLQGHFAANPERFSGCNFLLRHDAAFFWSKVQPALKAVAGFSGELAERVEKIVSLYGPVVEVMAGQPSTFVHGCYTPTQILLDLDGDPSRICPLDWERSARGSPLYDLTALSDGFQPPELYRLWDAYGETAAEHGLRVPDRGEMTRVVQCFRLQRIITWLSKSARKGYSAKGVARLVAAGERLSGTLS